MPILRSIERKRCFFYHLLQVKELKTRMEVLGKTDERLGMIENFNTRLGVFNDAVTEMENWIGDARHGIKGISITFLLTNFQMFTPSLIIVRKYILHFASGVASMSSSSRCRLHARRRTESREPWKYRRTS